MSHDFKSTQGEDQSREKMGTDLDWQLGARQPQACIGIGRLVDLPENPHAGLQLSGTNLPVQIRTHYFPGLAFLCLILASLGHPVHVCPNSSVNLSLLAPFQIPEKLTSIVADGRKEPRAVKGKKPAAAARLLQQVRTKDHIINRMWSSKYLIDLILTE